jgi:hypothetical protein
MPLIPWRKLQAGIHGEGTTQEIATALDHVQNGGTGATTSNGDFDTLIVKRLTVTTRCKIPCGTDMYE